MKPVSETFFARASIAGGDQCWNWQGALSPAGYGVIARGDGKGRLLLQAHRVAYEMAYQIRLSDDERLDLHHKCFNTRCVNPKHLTAVTRKQHMAWHKRGFCRKGHELTDENVIIERSGARRCLTCRREYDRGRPKR